MLDNNHPPLTTLGEQAINDIREDAIRTRIEAVASYRQSLSPFVTSCSPYLRVMDMLQSATYGEWAARTPEGSWLSVEELSWGTFVPELKVAEHLLSIASHPTVVLSRRRVDETFRYSLGDGGENGRG